MRAVGAAVLVAKLLIVQAFLQAQTAPTAEAFAGTIDHHYNVLRSLSVAFTQQYSGMGLNRTESGTLLLRKPGRLATAGQMRWTYSKPAGKLFVLDGHDAYFYTPGETEIPRVPAKKLDDLRSPLAFLLGRAQLAKQLENLTLSPSAGGEWTLTGVPRGMEKRVASLAITATAAGVITAMRVEETDGAVNLFRLTNEQPNVAVAASDFAFTPPAGTHVIEGMPPI
jgi:outer membrane lipoprotein carrier protein